MIVSSGFGFMGLKIGENVQKIIYQVDPAFPLDQQSLVDLVDHPFHAIHWLPAHLESLPCIHFCYTDSYYPPWILCHLSVGCC